MFDRYRSNRAAKRQFIEEYVQQQQKEWDALPGTRLVWCLVGTEGWQLISPDGSVWAGVCLRHGQIRDVAVGGRAYELRRPNIKHDRRMIEVNGGREVLRSTGRHYAKQANTRVELFDRGTLHFPVRELGEIAVMSALDESGRSLLEYRIQSTFTSVVRRMDLNQVEFIVNDTDLSRSQSALLVVFTSRLLPSYFDRTSAGT
jgi:hypothetical protein